MGSYTSSEMAARGFKHGEVGQHPSICDKLWKGRLLLCVCLTCCKCL